MDTRRMFLEGVETGRKEAVWSEVAKQLHLPLYECTEIWIKVQNDWLTDWELKNKQSKGKQFGVDISGKDCLCRRGLHALLKWPETTFIPAATTAALHTSHLQRLASIVETCTIFNWPNKHSGQQRRSQGSLRETVRLPVCYRSFLCPWFVWSADTVWSGSQLILNRIIIFLAPWYSHISFAFK